MERFLEGDFGIPIGIFKEKVYFFKLNIWGNS